jgi:TRAP-type transport system large permease protein
MAKLRLILAKLTNHRGTNMTIAIFLGSLLAAMALGIPIAFSLLLCGAALMWHMNMFDAQILAQNLIEGSNSFPLLAVPFFMLAGEVMNAGGLSRRIVNFAMALVGHIKGGLGYVTIVAAVIMASLSGSAVADAAALTALLLPMMVAAGHDKARSAGLIASAGIIAPIIPPSIGFVIFGVAGGVSITKLFMAGIFPGVMLAAALWFTWWYLVRKEVVTPPPRKNMSEVLVALKDATWALVLPLIIIFGLKFGIFTPTEAAVIAAVYALVISVFVYKELNFKKLVPLFISSAKTCSVVMFLVAAAMVSAWLITVANLPAQVVTLLEPLLSSPRMLMLAIMVLTMVVGTALDMTPTILLLTPVLMPVVKAAGIDPVYFGVLFIINNAIGLITPPVGTVLNAVAGVGKLRMDEVTKGVVPFMIAQFAIMFLMVMFPQLVMVPARWFY